MAIIIQNMGGSPNGVCRYQVRINQEVIAEFEHDRTKGLAACLKDAAKATKKAEAENLKAMMEWWK